MPLEIEIPATVDYENETMSGGGGGVATADATTDVAELVETTEGGDETETIEPATETTEPADETPKEKEPLLEPASETTHPTPQERAQEEFKQRVRDISDRLAKIALHRLAVEASLKEAKGMEKSVLNSLAELMREGPEELPLFDQPAQPQQQQAATDVAPDATTWAESCRVEPLQPNADEQWRSVPISELKLKPKLHERLEESGATTIGRLEDLRAEISQGREKWPKGIGKAKITEIEDALLDWLGRNRDRQVLAEAAHAPAPEPESQPEASQPATTTPAFHSGMEAYSKGWAIDDCPYVDPSQERKDWLAGWNHSYDSDI